MRYLILILIFLVGCDWNEPYRYPEKDFTSIAGKWEGIREYRTLDSTLVREVIQFEITEQYVETELFDFVSRFDTPDLWVQLLPELGHYRYTEIDVLGSHNGQGLLFGSVFLIGPNVFMRFNGRFTADTIVWQDVYTDSLRLQKVLEFSDPIPQEYNLTLTY